MEWEGLERRVVAVSLDVAVSSLIGMEVEEKGVGLEKG